MGNLFTELMRRLFGLLDYIVIFLIETLYSLLIKIADTNVFGDIIYHYLGRIYTFLGIFMVFKLSISMINYIINPDALTDKSKGFGKLISNVIISLILLVATPTLFNVAFDIQSDILSTNAVYQIITGYKLEGTKDIQNNSKIMGKRLAYGIYSTFIYDNKLDPMDASTTADDVKAIKDKSGNTCDTDDPYCLVGADTLILQESGKFVNQYWYLVSTVCGIAVAYMLLMFCFDASVRAIKLGVLQIIAPIPILSMIDPKKGNDQVMKWAKEAGKTFADLFIRLAGLFFAIDIISAILNASDTPGVMTSYSGGYGVAVNNIFVRLFVIVGCLMFAKQLPQFIENVLGVKLDGGGFNLKKKLGGAMGGAALVAGGAMLGRAGAALGKGGLNTLNASTRLGASALKNKITGQDNSAAIDRFKTRMGYTGQELKGRFGSLNKKYSGDTMSSLNKKMMSEQKAGAKEFKDFEKSQLRGAQINSRLEELTKGGMSSADANIAVFGERYGSSMNAVKEAKGARIAASQQLETAQQELQAALNAKANGHTGTYAGAVDVDSYISSKRESINNKDTGLAKLVQDAQDKVDKLTEAHKSLQKTDTGHAKMEADLKTFKTTN